MSSKWRPPIIRHRRSLSRKLSKALRVISGGMAATAWVIASFNACRVVGRYFFTCTFKCPQREKSQVNKSGDLGGQAMSPRNERRRPGNNSLRIPSERRE
ncbi:hypothetical protein TNCV_3127601 [Trichonephila clavipes]|nr:hypothetical protein TNCV_3127601 [Trichonephila clavipes]